MAEFIAEWGPIVMADVSDGYAMPVMSGEASVNVEPLVLRALAYLIGCEINRQPGRGDDIAWEIFEQLHGAIKNRG